MQSNVHDELANSKVSSTAKQPIVDQDDTVKRCFDQKPKAAEPLAKKPKTKEVPADSEDNASDCSGPQLSATARMLDAEDIQLGGEDSDNEEFFRTILAAAAAHGIPLDFLAAQGHHHSDEEDEDVEYPFEQPPQSLKHVAQFIQSDKCRNIVILAGAGMSVASGIPDFRSSNGLYATLDASLLSADATVRERIKVDPTYCLDQHLFLENPLPCLEVNREFILGVRDRKWKATLAHRFVELLQSQTGKLSRLYTQNIDGLEDQCPALSQSKRIAVHGSMDQAACAVCNHETPFEDFCGKVERQIKDITGQDSSAPRESTPIICESCGANSVKPNIVLFRSSLPKEFFQKVPEDVKHADLLIVMGTSLHVAPANSLVWRVPKHCMRVLLNREPVGWHLGLNFDRHERDFLGKGNCEDVVLELMEHLGYIDKLRPFLNENQLPDSSCKLLRTHLQQIQDKPSEIPENVP